MFTSRLPTAAKIRRVRTHQSSQGSAPEVFRVFLRLGLTSFGGPIAHLGYFREEFVTRRGWLSERQYAELVALCQFLPGPTSSQVGFAVGLSRAGTRGALAAWLAFTLPSVLLLLAFAAGAALFSGSVGRGVLAGLEAVAVAVVAHAVWGMARTLTPDLRRIVIGLGAAALPLLIPGSLGQVSAILFGIVAGLAVCRSDPNIHIEDRPLSMPITKRAAIVCLALLGSLLALLPIVAAATRVPLLGFIDAFTRAGTLVFGGGHVVLPLLQAEPAVASAVASEQLLAGYGAAQALPGPLFSFAAYLGAVAQPHGGLWWATVAVIAVFLPGMLLLVGVLPFWDRLRAIGGARAAIRGANAAVVGILAAALYRPLVLTGITGPLSLGIAGAALMLLAFRVPAWVAVLVGACVGAVAGALGVGTGWNLG